MYVLYTSEPDATLHVTDMNNKTELSKVIQLGEDQITLLKTELGKVIILRIQFISVKISHTKEVTIQ